MMACKAISSPPINPTTGFSFADTTALMWSSMILAACSSGSFGDISLSLLGGVVAPSVEETGPGVSAPPSLPALTPARALSIGGAA